MTCAGIKDEWSEVSNFSACETGTEVGKYFPVGYDSVRDRQWPETLVRRTASQESRPWPFSVVWQLAAFVVDFVESQIHALQFKCMRRTRRKNR